MITKYVIHNLLLAKEKGASNSSATKGRKWEDKTIAMSLTRVLDESENREIKMFFYA